MSKLVEIDQCQKTFLISTLVDIPFGSIIRKSKDLFNFYSCRYVSEGVPVQVKRPF